jgi:serine/threonine protein kinase
MSTDVVLGHYRIIREIARSNDIVYEALDTRINRRVAIKELFLPAGVTDSVRHDRIQRFQREARAAGQLTHPNIVTIFETEEEDGRYFIVMEYLEGETLRARMDREGTIPTEEAAKVILQILDALIEAHSKGVIHRDVKPENVHLLPDDRIKLTDFGIARLKYEPTITMDGQIFGTPSYMSPEQVVGQEIDERSDLFSVGTVFYEMIVGFKPFTGDSVVSITYNIMNTDPPSPPNLPYSFEWLIRHALQKSPQNRFSSAQEMKKAVQDALESLHTPKVFASPMGPSSGTTGGMPIPATVPATGTMYQATGTPYTPGGYQTMGASAQPAPSPVYIPPPPPPKPMLSPATRHFLGTVIAVVLIGSAMMALVGIGWYAISKSYERYELQKQDEQMASEFQQAEKLYKKGDYYQSAQLYYQLLQRAKSDKWRDEFKHNLAASLTGYGNQLLARGDLSIAAEAYQGALQYKSLPEAYDGLAQVDQRQGNWDGAVNNWLAAAENAGSYKAGEYRVKAAELLLELGNKAYKAGEDMEALRFWQQVIEEVPGTPQAEEARKKIDQALSSRMRN